MIKDVEGGAHGNHWEAYLGFEVGSYQEEFKQKVTEIIETLLDYPVAFQEKDLELRSEQGASLLLQNRAVVSGYPDLPFARGLQYSIDSVCKWKSGYGLEASIEGGLIKSVACRMDFFALDYLEKREVYENSNQVTISLTGLIMHIANRNKAFEDTSISFSDDFTGYTPYQEMMDTINFIGRIEAIEEYNNKFFEGYKLKVKIVDTGEKQLVLNFLLHKNLNQYPQQLVVGGYISAYAWMTGKIILP